MGDEMEKNKPGGKRKHILKIKHLWDILIFIFKKVLLKEIALLIWEEQRFKKKTKSE